MSDLVQSPVDGPILGTVNSALANELVESSIWRGYLAPLLANLYVSEVSRGGVTSREAATVASILNKISSDAGLRQRFDLRVKIVSANEHFPSATPS